MALDPVTAGFEFGKSALGILDQWVEDKDLKAKLAFELTIKQSEFLQHIYSAEAVPGYVKFLHAVRDLIIPMFRPIGGLAMTGYAVYAASKGIVIPDWLTAVLASAFPGWMIGRQVEKGRAQVSAQRATEAPKQPPPTAPDHNIPEAGG